MFGFLKKKEEKKETVAASEAAQVEPQAVPEEKVEEKQGWWDRLTGGLKKSTTQLGDGITGIFTKKKLDAETLGALEELLIKADLGPSVAARLSQQLSKNRFGKDITDHEVRTVLANEVSHILAPYAKPLELKGHKPFVLLMVGVNGAGKTTTMGKLAAQLKAQGKNVLMVAGDTFRAAAVSQLQVWGQRTGCDVIAGEANADPASLAYKGLEAGRANGADVVMVDTAGRLHNKNDLMAELQKIVRVIKKIDDTAPHATVLVLDATTGQNALAQVEVFKNLTAVTGLVLTKLDGSARGGVLLSLVEKYQLPVHAIGVGEGVEDLQVFDAAAFAKALCGVNEAA